MAKIDRRITKSQAAIKQAVIELMARKSFDDITIQDIADKANVSRGTIYLHYTDKYDLLDKLIQTHINELHDICSLAAEMDFESATLIWFEYFEKNYLFFSTMLASKGAPYFRHRLLDYILSETRKELNGAAEKNHGLQAEVVIQFVGSALVGTVEWWFANAMPYPPRVMARQVGKLLERNL